MTRFSWEGGVVLAPLAGITDGVFRRLVKRWHADLMVTEMVSAAGAVRNHARTLLLASFSPAERPLAIQLFGNNAEELAEAAARIEAEFHPDAIDLNCGCSMHKIAKSGSGARLLEDPRRLETIVRAMRARIRVPLSVKLRLGWRENVVAEAAERCVAAGADFLTLHPRLATQGFSGSADWEWIRRVRELVPVPVIGSGDVRSGADAKRMFDETGCAAVMIGRWAMGQPWALREAKAAIAGEPWSLPPGEGLRVLLEHHRLQVATRGDYKGTVEMRKFVPGYTRGRRGAAKLRTQLNAIETPDEFVAAVTAFSRRHDAEATGTEERE